jgi:hypothetical protein
VNAIDELRRLREWLINGNYFGHGPDVFVEINRRIAELEAIPTAEEVGQTRQSTISAPRHPTTHGFTFFAQEESLVDRLRRLAIDVANSGVSFDDERLKYVEVQIGRDTWDALQEVASG